MNEFSGIVIGLQRSGTEYLEQLLRVNFKNVTIKNHVKRGYFWKHSVNPNIFNFEDNFFHILISKNPYSWIESIQRNCVDMGGRHLEFEICNINGLTGDEIITSKNVLGEVSNFSLQNLCRLYNEFFLNWFISPKRELPLIIRIQYEHLIKINGFKGALQKIERNFGLNKATTSWRNVKKVGQSNVFTEEQRKKYLNMQTFDLTSTQIQIVNDNISDVVFEKLGYQKI